MKIAITGVGGGVGQSIMKSLYNTDYELVALDSEPLGAGLHATETSYVIPYANDPLYIEKLVSICQKEKVSLLFPGMDVELKKLAENKDLFSAIGTEVIVSNSEVIEVADDKLLTYQVLKEHGVSIPFTIEAHKYNPGFNDFPLILKPRKGGARSKNVFKINDIDHWISFKKDFRYALEDYILMEYVDGDEYTCGSVFLNNLCQGIIVMRRTLRFGDTYKCFSIKNALIENEVRKVVESIKPYGACNIQLKVKNNKPYIFEINARCSGTTAARAICGFNEPKMIADYVLKGKTPEYDIKEQTVLRYWKEIAVENENIEILRAKEGFLKQNNVKHL